MITQFYEEQVKLLKYYKSHQIQYQTIIEFIKSKKVLETYKKQCGVTLYKARL